MPHPFHHPAQRRCPNSPCKQAQTQPLQSSSAALTTHSLSSNDIFSRWKHQPRKGMLSGSASAGGELILGRRESALFFKSPLSERQQAASSDFLKTVLAEFRQPRSSPRRSPEQTGTRLPGVRHPPSTIHHKKERPAAHPDHKERSPNFHQLTIIHNHLRSAYNPIRSHQI